MTQNDLPHINGWMEHQIQHIEACFFKNTYEYWTQFLDRVICKLRFLEVPIVVSSQLKTISKGTLLVYQLYIYRIIGETKWVGSSLPLTIKVFTNPAILFIFICPYSLVSSASWLLILNVCLKQIFFINVSAKNIFR